MLYGLDAARADQASGLTLTLLLRQRSHFDILSVLPFAGILPEIQCYCYQ
jgi:hypothetical protein